MTTIAERAEMPQVLLIEDSHEDAILVQRAFKKADIPSHVTIARTAEVGLSILRREGGFLNTPFPDIVLLDIDLPYISGTDFLKLVKADPDLRLIPVIMMTNSTSEADLLETYKTYVNGFVTKPIGPADYDQVISTLEEYWFKLSATPETHASASLDHRKHAETPSSSHGLLGGKNGGG